MVTSEPIEFYQMKLKHTENCEGCELHDQMRSYLVITHSFLLTVATVKAYASNMQDLIIVRVRDRFLVYRHY